MKKAVVIICTIVIFVVLFKRVELLNQSKKCIALLKAVE